MKMYDLKNAEQALQKLVNTDLPIKIAFNLSSIIDDIDNQLKKFEDFRVKMIKKYGTETENGFEVLPENINSFEKEFNELLQLDINLDDIESIDIGLLEDVNFSIIEIRSLKNIGLIK